MKSNKQQKNLKPVEVPIPVLTYSYMPKKAQKIWCDSPFKWPVSQEKNPLKIKLERDRTPSSISVKICFHPNNFSNQTFYYYTVIRQFQSRNTNTLIGWLMYFSNTSKGLFRELQRAVYEVVSGFFLDKKRGTFIAICTLTYINRKLF